MWTWPNHQQDNTFFKETTHHKINKNMSDFVYCEDCGNTSGAQCECGEFSKALEEIERVRFTYGDWMDELEAVERGHLRAAHNIAEYIHRLESLRDLVVRQRGEGKH